MPLLARDTRQFSNQPRVEFLPLSQEYCRTTPFVCDPERFRRKQDLTSPRSPWSFMSVDYNPN